MLCDTFRAKCSLHNPKQFSLVVPDEVLVGKMVFCHDHELMCSFRFINRGALVNTHNHSYALPQQLQTNYCVFRWAVWTESISITVLRPAEHPQLRVMNPHSSSQNPGQNLLVGWVKWKKYCNATPNFEHMFCEEMQVDRGGETSWTGGPDSVLCFHVHEPNFLLVEGICSWT